MGGGDGQQRHHAAPAVRADAVEPRHLEEDSLRARDPGRLAGCGAVCAQQLSGKVLAAQQVRPAAPSRRVERRRELHQHVPHTAVLRAAQGSELRLFTARRRAGDVAGEGRNREALEARRPFLVGDRLRVAQPRMLQGGDGAVADDQVADQIVADAEQGDQHVIGVPAHRVRRQPQRCGVPLSEGAAEKSLRSQIVEEPGKVREDAVDVLLDQPLRRRRRVPPPPARREGVQDGDLVDATVAAHAVHGPLPPEALDLARGRVAATPRPADANDVVAGGANHPRQRRLADAQA